MTYLSVTVPHLRNVVASIPRSEASANRTGTDERPFKVAFVLDRHDRPMWPWINAHWYTDDRFRRTTPFDAVRVLGDDRCHARTTAVGVGIAVGAADGFGGTSLSARHDVAVPAGLFAPFGDSALALCCRDEITPDRTGPRAELASHDRSAIVGMNRDTAIAWTRFLAGVGVGTLGFSDLGA